MKYAIITAFSLLMITSTAVARIIQHKPWQMQDIISAYPDLSCDILYVINCKKDRAECLAPYKLDRAGMRLDLRSDKFYFMNFSNPSNIHFKSATINERGYDGSIVLSSGESFIDIGVREPGAPDAKITFSYTTTYKGNIRQTMVGTCDPTK